MCPVLSTAAADVAAALRVEGGTGERGARGGAPATGTATRERPAGMQEEGDSALLPMGILNSAVYYFKCFWKECEKQKRSEL